MIDIRNLNWIPVRDWSSLPATGMAISQYVTKTDMENFVEMIFREKARKLHIPYTEIESILKDENTPFYSTLNTTFERVDYMGLSRASEKVLTLQDMLRVPDVHSIPDEEKLSVEKFLHNFATLTNTEKVEVLQHLGNISITFEMDTIPEQFQNNEKQDCK